MSHLINHNVMFKVKDSVSQQAIDNAFNHLVALKNKLPGIVNIIYGECNFHETKGANSFSHCFSISFENEEAYNTFLTDPVTHSAKTCIVNIAFNEFEGIFGFDLV
jgi:hypothetical protein